MPRSCRATSTPSTSPGSRCCAARRARSAGASSLGGDQVHVANDPSTDGFEARFKASYGRPEGRRRRLRRDGRAEHARSARPSRSAPAASSAPTAATPIRSATTRFRRSRIPRSTSLTARASRRTINGSEVSGGRLSALFKPSDNFSLNLTALFPEHRQRQCEYLRSRSGDAASRCTTRLVASRYHEEFTNIDYKVFSATLDWDFGAGLLQSVTSYGEFSRKISSATSRCSTSSVPGSARRSC